MSTAAVLLAAAVTVAPLAPLAAALLADVCLHYQERPPAEREEELRRKRNLCFAMISELQRPRCVGLPCDYVHHSQRQAIIQTRYRDTVQGN